MLLLCAFRRGETYIYIKNHIPEGANIEEWYNTKIGVSAATVSRYTTFAGIIYDYPILLVCDLNFGQLLEHKERIYKYLKTDLELCAKLKLTVTICLGKHQVLTKPKNVSMPTVKYNNSCDFEYYDDVRDEYDGKKEYLDVIEEIVIGDDDDVEMIDVSNDVKN